MPSIESLPAETAALAEAIESTIAAAKEELTIVTLEEFISSKIGMFGKLIGSYAHFFQSCGVNSREELDALVRQQAGKQGSRPIFAAMEHLLDTEGEWDHFVLELDGRPGSAEAGQQQPALLSAAPCHLPLIDTVSGEQRRLADTAGTKLLVLLRHFAWLPWRDHVAQIQQQKAEFARLGCSVLVVSFGGRQGALRWLADTDCQFPLLLDPERNLYKAMGLGRGSIAKVWQHSTLQYYGEQKASGRQLPAAYTEVTDDPHQMGGDFIVDAAGRLTLVHCSTSPPDRPSVAALLASLEKQAAGDQ